MDATSVSAAGSSVAQGSTMHDSRVVRRLAKRALRNIAGQRAELRERARKAAKDTDRPDERARSLASLAQELEEVRKTVPIRVAEDAGATLELIAALRTTSDSVLASKGAARAGRAAVHSSFDELNELDGRILHELQLMVGSAREARKTDPSVPAIKSRVARQGKKKTGAAATPAGEPTKPG